MLGWRGRVGVLGAAGLPGAQVWPNAALHLSGQGFCRMPPEAGSGLLWAISSGSCSTEGSWLGGGTLRPSHGTDGPEEGVFRPVVPDTCPPVSSPGLPRCVHPQISGSRF